MPKEKWTLCNSTLTWRRSTFLEKCEFKRISIFINDLNVPNQLIVSWILKNLRILQQQKPQTYPITFLLSRDLNLDFITWYDGTVGLCFFGNDVNFYLRQIFQAAKLKCSQQNWWRKLKITKFSKSLIPCNDVKISKQNQFADIQWS